MNEAVDLWDVKVPSHPKIHKDVFIFMKCDKGMLKMRDCIGCLRGQLGQI